MSHELEEPRGGAAPSGGDTTTTEAASSESPEQQADHLQAEVEAAREDLGALVGELDRRRHRATKPLLLGAIAAAAVGIGGYVLWRVLRPRPSRLGRRTAERLSASMG